MIKVVAKNFVKADQVNEFKKIVNELVKETNEKDRGCIRYELFQDISDPLIFTIIEEWEDGDCLKEHSKAEHFLKAISQLPKFVEKEGITNFYKKIC